MSQSPSVGSTHNDLLLTAKDSPSSSSIESSKLKNLRTSHKFTFRTIPKPTKSTTAYNPNLNTHKSRHLHKNNGTFNAQTIAKKGSKLDPIIFDDEEKEEEFSEGTSLSSRIGLETQFLSYDRNQPPADEIVHSLFIQFLHQRAFDEQTKNNLLRQSTLRKWTLICLDFHSRQEADEKQRKVNLKGTEPSWFLSRSRILTEDQLHRMERLLRGENFALMFLKDYGHIALLRDVDTSSGDFEFLVINCIKNCLNFDVGFDYFNEDLTVLRYLIEFTIDSPKVLNRLNALEVLLKISNWKVPLGRNNILKAFHQLHQSSNLFEPWFESLRSHLLRNQSVLTIAQSTVFMNYLSKSIHLMTSLLKNCESVNDQKIIHLKFKEIDIYSLFGRLREFNNTGINIEIEAYKSLEVEIFSNEIISELNLGDTNFDLLLRNLRFKVGTNQKDELFQLNSQIIKDFMHILSNQTKTESTKFFKLIANLIETVSDTTNYKTVSNIKGTDQVIQSSIKTLMDKLSSEDLTKRALKELEEAEMRNESLTLEIQSLKSATTKSTNSPSSLMEEYEQKIKEKDEEIEKLRSKVRELTYRTMHKVDILKPLKAINSHQTNLLQSLNRRSVSLSSTPPASNSDYQASFQSSASLQRSNSLRGSSRIYKSKSGLGLQAFLEPQNATKSSDSFESINVSSSNNAPEDYAPPQFSHTYLGSRQGSMVSSVISEISENQDCSRYGTFENLTKVNDSFESIENGYPYDRYLNNDQYSEISDEFDSQRENDGKQVDPGTNYSSTVIPMFFRGSEKDPYSGKLDQLLSNNSSLESVVIRKDQTINFGSNDPTFRSRIFLPPSDHKADIYQNTSSESISNPPPPLPPSMPDFLQKTGSSTQTVSLGTTLSNSSAPPPPPPPSLPGFLSSLGSSSSSTSKPRSPVDSDVESNDLSTGNIPLPPPPPPPPSLPSFLSSSVNTSSTNQSVPPPTPPPPPPPPPPPAPPLFDVLRLNQSMPELGSSLNKSGTPPPPPPSLPLFLQSESSGSSNNSSIPPPPPPPPMPLREKTILKTHSKKLSEVLTSDDLQQITNSLKSNKKLKQLHWDKVESVQDTIWDTSKSVRIDELKELGVFKEIENLFTVKESNLKLASVAKDTDKNGLIAFLPRDLSQQFGINLHMFANYSELELVSLVLKCSYEVLDNISVLEFFNKDELCSVPITLLKKFGPFVTDYVKNKSPKEDPAKLDRSDRIFLELCVNLKHYWRSRSRALLVIKTYERDYYDLLTKLQKVDDSVKAIRESENLKGLFLLIREIGNFMNRKSVEGFKLASLSKLGFIKDAGNQGSFLHYVERVIRRMYPEYLGFLQELGLLAETARINIDQLTADIQTFISSVKNIQTSMKDGNLSDSSKFHPDDMILSKLKPKLPQAIQRCEMLENQQKFIMQDFSKLMKYFSENDKDGNSRNTFLLKFFEFLNDFKKVQVENFESEEKAKIQEKRKLMALESQKKSKEIKLSQSKEDQESDLIFESLIKRLKSTKVSEKRRVSSTSELMMQNKDRLLLSSGVREADDNEIITRAQTLLKETQNI